ncbi:hypothetical protein [Sphingopyxis sp.]|uniref:hypothetical protein n=1 Tax=Sphingopyxis sp. TaxID=1908224 RepID=UPI002B467EB1|nr:hypothetical protein [Sphingopyxis sp.]HJS12970.1 hypothetical protein [Sphingopyxis sp.]
MISVRKNSGVNAKRRNYGEAGKKSTAAPSINQEKIRAEAQRSQRSRGASHPKRRIARSDKIGGFAASFPFLCDLCASARIIPEPELQK